MSKFIKRLLRRLLLPPNLMDKSYFYFESLGRVRVWDSVGWNGLPSCCSTVSITLVSDGWKRTSPEFCFVPSVSKKFTNVINYRSSRVCELFKRIPGAFVYNMIPPWARARQKTSERLATQLDQGCIKCYSLTIGYSRTNLHSHGVFLSLSPPTPKSLWLPRHPHPAVAAKFT